jgi:hypothetical protein
MKDIEPTKGEIVMYQPDETIRLHQNAGNTSPRALKHHKINIPFVRMVFVNS